MRAHIIASVVRKHVLAIAVVAGAVLLSSARADAQQKGTLYTGPMCSAQTGPNSWTYYVPGDKVTDIYGNKWVCGPDGKWFRDYSAATTASSPIDIKQAAAVVQVIPVAVIR